MLESVPAAEKGLPFPALSEFEGTIKWFDPNRGMGFVSRSDGGGDILLHITCFAASGFYEPDFIFDDSKVKVEAVLGSHGWNCSRILSLEKGPNKRRLRPQSIKHAVNIPLVLGPALMRVKWFNRKQGYGFFEGPDVGEDVFVHKETLRSSGTRLDLVPGEDAQVMYGADENDHLRGLKAVSVKLLSP